MRAFAHPRRLLLAAMVFCSSVTLVYSRDAIDVRFTHQTHSVNTPIAELHKEEREPKEKRVKGEMVKWEGRTVLFY